MEKQCKVARKGQASDVLMLRDGDCVGMIVWKIDHLRPKVRNHNEPQATYCQERFAGKYDTYAL
jgi:hypothetical protein